MSHFPANLKSPHSKSIDKKLLMVFVDYEKAFDSVNWLFILKVLEKVDAGENFIKWIQAIYRTQKAQILINNDLSEEIRIERGTRQGCPISPLLFDLVIEVFLLKVKQEKSIQGIKIKGREHKLRAFADDVLVTLSEPLESIVPLIAEMDKFEKVSGLKVNKNKTSLVRFTLAKRGVMKAA